MTGNPELEAMQAKIEDEVRRESLHSMAGHLLADQVAVLDGLGVLVKRHALLERSARKHPDFANLTRVAQLALAAVTEARYLETKLSDARMEIIEALAEMDQTDN